MLIAAWPLVIERAPDARLMIAGFGAYRQALLDLARSLGDGDLAAARVIASRGRQLEGGPPGELHFLAAFLDGLTGTERERYLAASRAAMRRIHFAGRIEHDDVSELMCASAAVVIPSTFPEAFGMVLAEAACCGSMPLSAAHSGLAEVTELLVPGVRQDLRPKLSFQLGSGAVRQIADKLGCWLSFTADTPNSWRHARAKLAELACAEFGWEEVAHGVAAAAQGRLAGLPGMLPALTATRVLGAHGWGSGPGFPGFYGRGTGPGFNGRGTGPGFNGWAKARVNGRSCWMGCSTLAWPFGASGLTIHRGHRYPHPLVPRAGRRPGRAFVALP